MALPILLYPGDAAPVSGRVIPSFISLLLTPASAWAGSAVAMRLPAASTVAASQVLFLRVFPIIVFLPSRVVLLDVNLLLAC